MEESRGVSRLMARRTKLYMQVKHGKDGLYLGAYVATRFGDTGLVRSTKTVGRGHV